MREKASSNRKSRLRTATRSGRLNRVLAARSELHDTHCAARYAGKTAAARTPR